MRQEGSSKTLRHTHGMFLRSQISAGTQIASTCTDHQVGSAKTSWHACINKSYNAKGFMVSRTRLSILQTWVSLMHDLHSTRFLFSLVLLPCLPFLPRLTDVSALQLPHELLSDDISPDKNVSRISRDSCCRSHIRYMVTTKLTGAAICQKYLHVVSKDFRVVSRR